MEIYFWTFVVAVLVLLAGGGVSLWTGIHRLASPKSIDSATLSLVVIGLSAVFEGVSFTIEYREYKRVSRVHTIPNLRVGLWKFIKWSKDPKLYESLLEDWAALVGLLIAAVGISASAFFHLLWADGLASCAIGFLLIADAVVILMATRSLIAGEAVALPLQRDMEQAVCGKSAMIAVTDLVTLHLGPTTILVVVKVDPAPDMTANELRKASTEITEKLRAVDPRISYIFFRY